MENPSGKSTRPTSWEGQGWTGHEVLEQVGKVRGWIGRPVPQKLGALLWTESNDGGGAWCVPSRRLGPGLWRVVDPLTQKTPAMRPDPSQTEAPADLAP